MKLLLNYYNVYKYLLKNKYIENENFKDIKELYDIVDNNLYKIQKIKPDIYKYLNTENFQINEEYLNNHEINKFITNKDNINKYMKKIHDIEIKEGGETKKEGEEGGGEEEEVEEEVEGEGEVEGGFTYNKSNKKSKKSKQQLRKNSSRKK